MTGNNDRVDTSKFAVKGNGIRTCLSEIEEVSTPTDGSGETDGRHPLVLDCLSSSLSASNREKDVKSGELFLQDIMRELNQPLGEAGLRGVFLHDDGTSSGQRRRDITAQNPKSKTSPNGCR